MKGYNDDFVCGWRPGQGQEPCNASPKEHHIRVATVSRKGAERDYPLHGFVLKSMREFGFAR